MIKELPNNIESELLVLGSIILDNSFIPDVSLVLKSKYFFSDVNQSIYSVIIKMHESSMPIDTVSLYEQIQSLKLNVDVQYLAKLTKDTTYLANVIYHSYIIIEKFLLRELIKKSEKIRELAYNQENDVFEMIEDSVAELESVLSVREEAKEEKNLYDKLDEIFNVIKEERDGNLEPSIKFTNHPSFNRATGGIRNGNVILITGKYKQGKTTVATSLFDDLAINGKKMIGGWFSLEVSEFEMDIKHISQITGTRYGYLRNPADKTLDGHFRFSEDMLRDTILEAKRKLFNSGIYTSDETADLLKIRNKLKLWIKKFGLQFAVIDYLGLLESEGKYERKDLQISETSKKIKRIARELNIPIFILEQENEDGKTSNSKGPIRDADYWFSITNLKDAGKNSFKIREDGIDYDYPIDNSHFEVKLKASRHSPAGVRILYKYLEDGRFVEVDYKHKYEYSGDPI